MSLLRSTVPLAAFAALSLSTAASAEANTSSCSSISCTGKVELLYASSSGDLHIRLDAPGSPGNCNLYSNVYITLKRDVDNFEPMSQTLLAAELSGRNIRLRTTADSAGRCQVNYLTFGSDLD